MREFALKFGDTVLWALIGGGALSGIMKVVQTIQHSLHRREDRGLVMKAGSK